MSQNKSRISGLLAYRFLLSKSSDGFISLIAWVSVVGVALGVLALIVVTSVINGFEGELTRVVSGMNGDVVLYSRGNPVRQTDYVYNKIKRIVPEVSGISPSFITELMVSGPDGVAGGVLDGFDSDTIGEVTTVPESLESGRLPTKGEVAEVALGFSLAERIGAKIGHEVRLIAPFAEKDLPKVIPAEVVGLVKMGMHQYDSKFIFAPLELVQKQLSEPGSVTTFKLRLKGEVDSFEVADRLSDQFGYPFRAKNWGQLNRNLFYAIRLEKVVIAIILTAITIVAAFNVVTTLMMMIHDKTQEMSILKAMGLRKSECFRVFCLIGMMIGAVGTLVGLVLGLLSNRAVESTRWVDLPADVYHIDFLPVIARWDEIGLILFFAILICFLATVYPAIQIARRSPLRGLRYDS